MKIKLVFALVLFQLISIEIFAQSKVVRSESFDGTFFPTLGWSTGTYTGADINNYCERVTTGTSPSCLPHSGAGMIRYRSGFMVSAGAQAFMVSPRFDLTNNPGTATVSFWMYKDNVNSVQDSVTLYINNQPNAGAGKVKVIGPVSRVSGGFIGWKKFSAVIPAGFNTSSAHFVFVFTNRETSGTGANIYIDDFKIETYPKPQSLVSSSLFYQATHTVANPSVDQVIIGIKVTTDGAGDSLKVDSIVTNANGSSSIMDVVNPSAKIWCTKGTNFFTPVNQFGTAKPATYFRDVFTQSNFFLENGDNYFWLTYSVTASAATGNYIDADFNGIYYRKTSYAGADTSRSPLKSSAPGGRPIGTAVCGGNIPSLVYGTSGEPIDSYTNNDFINRVYLRGANSIIPSYPYIDNNINSVGPPIPPWNSGPAPFSAHPPDYEQFASTASVLHPHITTILQEAAVYATPSLVAGNPVGAGLALQCGTYSSFNYMAAWIDFNNDGDFLDAGEKINQSTGMNALIWTFAPVIIPTVLTPPTPGIAGPGGIQYGNTVLRVREVHANTNIQPCESGYLFGETEDYVVSIIPGCVPGVKLWLGYTDDWNNPGNWCGGVPTINDVVLIDETGYLAGAPNGANYEPVIHSGTHAAAKTIRIAAGDSLIVDASQNGSLQIADSLAISYNTPIGGNGYMKINSAFADTAQHANGNLAFVITPFQGNRKNMRMQLIYTKADLAGKGMIAGDNIDQFIFHIRQRANPSVPNYPGFTIRYATVDSTWTNVCWPVGPPTSLAPVTSPYITIFNSATLTLPMAPGTAGDLTINLTTPMYWNGVSDLVVDICFSAPSNSIVAGTDLVCQTAFTNINKVMWLNNSSSSLGAAGCGLGFPVSGAFGTAAAAAQFRPNITFHFKRTYAEFPITIAGNGGSTAGKWVNNGYFTAGSSNVIFSNSQLNQSIAGANTTVFSQLTVNKSGPGNKLTIHSYTQVDSLLLLSGGKLELNKNILYINNTSPSAISRSAGGIISETTNSPYGSVSWKMNSNTLNHIFPFITNTSDYIPFSFKNNSGNIGNVSVATYPANNKIKPYPDGVTNINDSLGNNDSAYTVRRFWVINKTGGGGGNADIKFSYRNAEAPSPIVKSNLKANRYDYATDLWQRFNLPVTTTIGGNVSSVTISNVTAVSLVNASWALSDASHPLRIQGEQQPFAQVFPNPFTESFQVSWEENESFKLQIFDMQGRMVFEKMVSSGDIIMPEAQLIRGVYLVMLKNSSQVEQFRLVKTD